MSRKTIIALIYDFDGTLSPGNMQEFGFIQTIGKTPEEFWTMSDNIAIGQDASNVLSYMKLMYDEAHMAGIRLSRKEFHKPDTQYYVNCTNGTTQMRNCLFLLTQMGHIDALRIAPTPWKNHKQRDRK